MNEDIISHFSHPIPAYSALYHCVDDMIFTKGKYAYKITNIFKDRNGRNKPILNPERLKDKLFREIMKRYNERIDKHLLIHPYYQKLTLDRKDELKLEGYHLITGMSDTVEDYSGTHMIFPRSFVCQRCGDMKMPSKEAWQSFNPNKCQEPNCPGKYEQISLMLFCEDCGNLSNLYYTCAEHGTKSIRLIRGSKDSLRTWQVVCKICYKEKKTKPIDIFRLTCKHKDENKNKVRDDETKYKPLSIKEGGIYSPVVITTIDIQGTESIDLDNLEQILLALHLELFRGTRFFDGDEEFEVVLDDIVERFESYKQKRSRGRFIEECKQKGVKEEEAINRWKAKWKIDVIEETISLVRGQYGDVDLEILNDYFSICGKYVDTNNLKYSYFIEQIPEPRSKLMRKKKYDELKLKYGIKEITYVPQINLISSCIGLIHGVNKFWEDDFVAHFNPIWNGKGTERNMIAYTYPFDTEGILLELDRIKVVNWLIRNKLLDANSPINDTEASELLLKIKKDTKEYVALKTLIHTLSHVLINRSSIYTGLDGDSSSELLFPNSAAILIYGTSNINIGGFAYIFEHSLSDWFNDIEFDMKECTFDLTCIHEKGACFSCLYLPEFVCSEFNAYLDRAVYIGKRRYEFPYW